MKLTKGCDDVQAATDVTVMYNMCDMHSSSREVSKAQHPKAVMEMSRKSIGGHITAPKDIKGENRCIFNYQAFTITANQTAPESSYKLELPTHTSRVLHQTLLGSRMPLTLTESLCAFCFGLETTDLRRSSSPDLGSDQQLRSDRPIQDSSLAHIKGPQITRGGPST